MRKISGQLLSSKPVSLSRAAKLMTRFAAVDTGSSATVSLYLQRTADAFNHLVQFHNKLPKISNAEISPDRRKGRKLGGDKLEKNPDEKTAKDSKTKGKKEKNTVDEAAEINPNLDEVNDSKAAEKKKKKRKSDGDDSKEKSKKKRIVEDVDS